jgi:hypothetical protein
VPRTDDRNQIDARLDFQVAARSHLFARYSQSDGDITQGSLFGPPGNGHPNVAALGDAQQLPLLNSIAASSLVIGGDSGLFRLARQRDSRGLHRE